MTTFTKDQAAQPTPYALGPDEGEHLHFLDNLATVKVRPGETGAMSAIEFSAPRGFGPPLHCHDDEDEIMVILDGEIEFRSGDNSFVGATGSTVYLPHGVPHTFQVLSDTARFSCITASVAGVPRFARMVTALGVETDEAVIPEPMDIDPGQVAAVGAQNGVQIIGPPPAPLG